MFASSLNNKHDTPFDFELRTGVVQYVSAPVIKDFLFIYLNKHLFSKKIWILSNMEHRIKQEKRCFSVSSLNK